MRLLTAAGMNTEACDVAVDLGEKLSTTKAQTDAYAKDFFIPFRHRK